MMGPGSAPLNNVSAAVEVLAVLKSAVECVKDIDSTKRSLEQLLTAKKQADEALAAAAAEQNKLAALAKEINERNIKCATLEAQVQANWTAANEHDKQARELGRRNRETETALKARAAEVEAMAAAIKQREGELAIEARTLSDARKEVAQMRDEMARRLEAVRTAATL